MLRSVGGRGRGGEPSALLFGRRENPIYKKDQGCVFPEISFEIKIHLCAHTSKKRLNQKFESGNSPLFADTLSMCGEKKNRCFFFQLALQRRPIFPRQLELSLQLKIYFNDCRRDLFYIWPFHRLCKCLFVESQTCRGVRVFRSATSIWYFKRASIDDKCLRKRIIENDV